MSVKVNLLRKCPQRAEGGASDASGGQEEGRGRKRKNCSSVTCQNPRQPWPRAWQGTLQAPGDPCLGLGRRTRAAPVPVPLRAASYSSTSPASSRLGCRRHPVLACAPSLAGCPEMLARLTREPLSGAQWFVLTETGRTSSLPTRQEKNQTVTEINAVQSYKSES